jgi:beta-N-acetylhexosaminidase
MSDRRRARETPELVRELVRDVQACASGPLIVAVDEELVGIRRFDQDVLVGRRGGGCSGTSRRTRGARREHGSWAGCRRRARSQPMAMWAKSRPDPGLVARLGAALIEGFQGAGVTAIAKHYPGHAVVEDDPAVARARVQTSLTDLDTIDAAPFRAAVASGVRGIMLGPAVIEDLDPHAPASISPSVVRHARETLGFEGALVTDDLDAISILRDRQIGDVAVAAIAAGADLLLVAAAHADDCAEALEQAVRAGELDLDRLSDAAVRVERLAAASSQLAAP